MKPQKQQTGVDKYEILGKLATGGMAEIYLARATGLEGFAKHVVLKRILPEYAETKRYVDMFLDEARLTAQLHHQNIAQVYDIGQVGKTYFFTMEYLHGEDLRNIMKTVIGKEQKLPLKHALTLVAGAAAGLHYAHDKRDFKGEPLKIVHRDVSLSNIVATYDGGVKLVDFGVAKANERSTETRVGSVKGKVSYMSPEQCQSHPLDRRSDVYSLGIVLWELVTSSRLYRHGQDDGDYNVMQRIVLEDVPPPSSIVPDLPEGLDNIVLKALAKSPEDRYATTNDLLIELEELAAKTGFPLSTASLAKYLTDLFGERREPWNSPGSIQPAPAYALDRTVSTTHDVGDAFVIISRGVDAAGLRTYAQEAAADEDAGWAGIEEAQTTVAEPSNRIQTIGSDVQLPLSPDISEDSTVVATVAPSNSDAVAALSVDSSQEVLRADQSGAMSVEHSGTMGVEHSSTMGVEHSGAMTGDLPNPFPAPLGMPAKRWLGISLGVLAVLLGVIIGVGLESDEDKAITPDNGTLAGGDEQSDDKTTPPESETATEPDPAFPPPTTLRPDPPVDGDQVKAAEAEAAEAKAAEAKAAEAAEAKAKADKEAEAKAKADKEADAKAAEAKAKADKEAEAEAEAAEARAAEARAAEARAAEAKAAEAKAKADKEADAKAKAAERRKKRRERQQRKDDSTSRKAKGLMTDTLGETK